MNENPQSNIVWEDKLTWFKSSPQYRTLNTTAGEPMEFEWNIFPGFTTLQLCNKVHEFMIHMGELEKFQGRITFMSMLNDIIWRNKDNETECIAISTLVTICKKDFFQQDVGHFSDLDQKRSGILLMVANHKENGTESLNWWWSNSEKRTPSFPSHESVVLRNAQKQRRWEIINTLLCWWRNDWNCFSHNYFCQSAQY